MSDAVSMKYKIPRMKLKYPKIKTGKKDIIESNLLQGESSAFICKDEKGWLWFAKQKAVEKGNFWKLYQATVNWQRKLNTEDWGSTELLKAFTNSWLNNNWNKMVRKEIIRVWSLIIIHKKHKQQFAKKD